MMLARPAFGRALCRAQRRHMVRSGLRPGWALAGLAAVTGAASLVVLVLNVPGLAPADRQVARAVFADDGTARQLVDVVAQVGSGALLYPLLVLLAVRRRTRLGALAPLILVAGQVLESLTLSALPRVGPDLAWSGLSSGRTATAVLGWGLLLLVAGVAGRRALGGGVAVGVLVAAARVVGGQHWPSDVAVALLFGAALLCAVIAIAGPIDAQPVRWTAGLRRLPGTPWALAVAAVAAAVAVVPPLLEPNRMGDLAVYVGSAGVAGEGGDLYAFRSDRGLPFTYPPFAALLAEPLARIPWPLVQLLWTAGSLAAVVAVAAIVLRPVAARIGLPLTVALLLLSTPVRSHLRFGQVGLFLLLLVSADLLGRTRRQGWGVGLAAAVKLTPAIYLPWMLVTGQNRRLLATVGWAGGAALLGMALLWPSSPSWLLDALWDSSRFGRNDIPGNQSVRGMLLRALDDDALAEQLWLLAALTLLLAGVLGARRLELVGDRLGAVAVLAAASVAVSPISWQHHLVWLALGIAALVAVGRLRLAAAWAAVLIAPVTTLGTHLDVPLFGPLIVNTCGLTAVAAVVLLPRLLQKSTKCRDDGIHDAEPVGSRPELGESLLRARRVPLPSRLWAATRGRRLPAAAVPTLSLFASCRTLRCEQGENDMGVVAVPSCGSVLAGSRLPRVHRGAARPEGR